MLASIFKGTQKQPPLYFRNSKYRKIYEIEVGKNFLKNIAPS